MFFSRVAPAPVVLERNVVINLSDFGNLTVQPSAAPVVTFVALSAVYGVEPHILPNRVFSAGALRSVLLTMRSLIPVPDSSYHTG